MKVSAERYHGMGHKHGQGTANNILSELLLECGDRLSLFIRSPTRCPLFTLFSLQADSSNATTTLDF